MDTVTLGLAAGNAVVKAAATEGWGEARAAVTSLWRRHDAKKAEAVSADLDDTRESVLAARKTNDDLVEQDLAHDWYRRFLALMQRSPDASPEVQAVLDNKLRPLLPSQDQDRVVGIQQSIRAGRDVYVAGGDMITGNISHGQTINER